MKVVVHEVDRIGMKVDFRIIEVIGGSTKKKVARNFSGKNPSGKRGEKPKGRRKNSARKKIVRKSSQKNARRQGRS
jgi:hypothetical protein